MTPGDILRQTLTVVGHWIAQCLVSLAQSTSSSTALRANHNAKITRHSPTTIPISSLSHLHRPSLSHLTHLPHSGASSQGPLSVHYSTLQLHTHTDMQAHGVLWGQQVGLGGEGSLQLRARMSPTQVVLNSKEHSAKATEAWPVLRTQTVALGHMTGHMTQVNSHSIP